MADASTAVLVAMTLLKAALLVYALALLALAVAVIRAVRTLPSWHALHPNL